jgi:phosphate transport system substrate-binding protein
MSSTDPPAAPPPASSGPSAAANRPRHMVRRAGPSRRYVAVAVVAIAAVVVGAGYATHWYGLEGPTHGITLEGSGASFLLSLMSKWQSEFASAYAPNQISYNPGGAGAGITALTDKDVNFAATDEPLTPAETAALPGATLTLPVTGGPVVVVYDLPGFSGTLDLNATQLVDIYSGTVTSWGASALVAHNPGLSGLSVPIVPVVRLDAAGTTYVLTNYLSDDVPSWSSSVGTSIQPTWPSLAAEQAEKGNSGLAKYVAGQTGAIGYCDLPDALTNHLSVAGIENPSLAYIVPTVANTQSAIDDLAGQPLPPATGNWASVSWVNAPGATDYPLATLSYFLVLQNAADGYHPSLKSAQALVDWLTWTVTTGQQYAAPLDYDEPPAALLTADQSAICSINYNGPSVASCG